MYKPIYIFIGFRYFWNSHLTNFKKIITILSIIGVSIGTASIIITMSLSNGFQSEFKKNILSFIPHLIITNNSYYINESKFPKNILKLKNIQKVSGFISNKVLVQSKKNITIGEIITFKEENYNTFKTYNIKNYLYTLNSKEKNIILGKKLAEKLNVNINDSIKLIILPNNKKNFLKKKINAQLFKITGLFNTKNDIDSYQMLINTEIALNFLNYDKNYVTGWRVWLRDPFSFNINTFKIKKNNLIFLDWKKQQGEFFKAIQIEKYIMFLFFILILLIVGINIVITLTVNIIEKQNIIAILQTQGLCRKKIMLIFVTLGASTTIIGNFLGTLISFILIFQGKIINFLINTLFSNVSVPIKIFPIQTLIVNIVFTLISILSTLYPIWSITKSTPSKILSYE
ncbi:ABC transporter permease [Buchnera aphidicola]|uniref:FtsX-like permease family protein n=1 Tax=Buchnera aphidicola (Aphis gossypii) TaxID=98785 RepID=A0A5J6ZDI0_9GAMM|nr:ABC transporter permease [Buchnera aphidicola]QFQ32123.1 FtsX-like permease family protein [Buchnera aphidicola (Aphis gossypii)]